MRFILIAVAAMMLAGQAAVPELGPQAEALKSEVERLYGQEVRIETVELPPGTLAFSAVEDGGQPVIQMPLGATPLEEDIVHELFHLKLKAQGYAASYRIQAIAPFVANIMNRLSPFVKYQLRDSIQHSIFYPEMKKMGFDPHATYRKDLESKLAMFSIYVDADPQWQTETLAIQYFFSAVEANDTKLMERLRQVYDRNRWGASVRRAQALFRIIEGTPPSTPEAEIELLVKSLNCVMSRLATFKVGQWETRTKGQFSEKIAVIEAGPRSFSSECPAL